MADLKHVRLEEWSPHYNDRDYGGEWRGVALRSIGGASNQLSTPPGTSSAAFSATDVLQRCAYFREILSAFPCPLKAVRLLTLTPGSFVREHSDPTLGYEDGEMRIHIPIRTGADVEFYLAGERLHLEEGNCYYLNVSLPHRICNRGSDERVHLVIDIGVDEWAHQVVKQGLPIARLPHRPLGFEYFHERVLRDSSLAEQLQAAADIETLRQSAVAIGQNLGFDFIAGEVGSATAFGEERDSDLRGWVPASVLIRDNQPVAEWIYFGRRRFTEPFFDESVRNRLQNPFAKSFRFESPLREPETFLDPTGFIFHMSRCGSTLISRALAALPRVVAVSEAPPIDVMVQTRRSDWVRAIILALGQPREGDEDRYFIKFDAWHIHYLPAIRAAFSDTPWIFVYRDPLEVLVSQVRKPGMLGLPGAMDPAIFGMSFDDIIALSRGEWCARVLAGFLRSALDHRGDPAGLFINYHDLPEAIWDNVAKHFRMEFDESEIGLMRDTAQFHAKMPWQPFATDSGLKQLDASPVERALAEEFLHPLYRQLSC